MITIGVEEEYLLLDPQTGRPVALVDEVRKNTELDPSCADGEVQNELLQAQIEIGTPVCGSLEELGGHLLRLRHTVGTAAEAAGCRIAASGTAPFADHWPVPVTATDRYLGMLSDAPQLVDEQLINGMHVHVGIPDRACAVRVLNRLRPWLPTIVAMGANSPIWHSRDTGFASWRTVVFGRWPVSGVPPLFLDRADYEGRADVLVRAGIIRDRAQLYWQARLSDRYPTIEVRSADVQLRPDDAVMIAGIVRALIATALRADGRGDPVVEPPPEMLAGALWNAARRGLGGTLVDGFGRRQLAVEAVGALMEHIADALAELGDTRQVTALVQRLLREGTGADRQSRVLREAGPAALSTYLVDETSSL